jgi:L-lactate utilization protein LutB
MTEMQKNYYDKRAALLVKNLQNRHFEAYYCATKEDALHKALSLIPVGASVGWGGALSAQQIGLIDAVRAGEYRALDRDACKTPEEREQIMRYCLLTDVFITGANALSMDGQMVNIDGNGNRVAAIVYGPKQVIVIAGMNKVEDTLEAAVTRARTVAAPMNQQRFMLPNPCTSTGTCADCKSETCICNQILITRHCRPAGRIKFILVGEDLGL